MTAAIVSPKASIPACGSGVKELHPTRVLGAGPGWQAWVRARGLVSPQPPVRGRFRPLVNRSCGIARDRETEIE